MILFDRLRYFTREGGKHVQLSAARRKTLNDAAYATCVCLAKRTCLLDQGWGPPYGVRSGTDCLPAAWSLAALVVVRRFGHLADGLDAAKHPAHNITQRTPRTDATPHDTPHCLLLFNSYATLTLTDATRRNPTRRALTLHATNTNNADGDATGTFQGLVQDPRSSLSGCRGRSGTGLCWGGYATEAER